MQLAFRNGAYFLCDVLLNFFFSFQMKDFEINGTSKKIKKKTEAEIKKQLEESITNNKNVNTDIEESERNGRCC